MLADTFSPDAFSLQTMTAAISNGPYKPGFVSRRGLFTEKGVSTNTVLIEQREGTLRLVQTSNREGPVTAAERKRRKIRSFVIPHLIEYDYAMASEVIGVRAFGQEQTFQTVDDLRNERSGNMADNLDVTLEYHRVGAIQGVVLDADGSVLFDLFDEFDVTPLAEVDFDLDNANAVEGALLKKCNSVTRAMANELGATELTGVEALCGDAFFDDLITVKEVRDVYRYQEAARNAAGLVFNWVRYGDITWINYRNGGFNLINTDKCHLYPVGVKDLFLTRFGPANYIETANTIGLPRYAKGVVDPWGKRVDFEAQSNPLNICTKPRALRTGRRT
jgi:hypothetical protein